MSPEELKNLFNAATVKIAEQGTETFVEGKFFVQTYINMFKEYPNIISIDLEGFYLNKKAADEYTIDEDEDDEYREDDEQSEYLFDNIAISKTMINFAETFADKAYIVRKDTYPVIIMDKCILFFSAYYHQIYALCNVDKLPQEIIDCVVDRKNDEMTRWFSFVTMTSQGFNETSMKVKKQDIDLTAQYNDDIPDKEIKDFIKGSQSGLLLLHGDPGTGKTTYIRHLMHTIKGRKFMVLDQSVFNYITDASFIQMLLDNRNSVIVLEDCESMLADRVSGNNTLSALLNLSDGIIGDSFNFKFICTFNANVQKLDKALLRKGRMKLKYEFKKLTAEKTKALAESINKNIPEGSSLSLAEIYNYGEDNGAKEDKKIGFGK